MGQLYPGFYPCPRRHVFHPDIWAHAAAVGGGGAGAGAELMETPLASGSWLRQGGGATCHGRHVRSEKAGMKESGVYRVLQGGISHFHTD